DASSAKADGRSRIFGWWEVRTNVAEETAGRFETVKEAAGGRFGGARPLFSGGGEEPKRAPRPPPEGGVARTAARLLTPAFFGLYLFALDAILLKAYEWVLHTFGAA